MTARLKIEELLDQALAELKEGRSLEAVLARYPEEQREALGKLIAVAHLAHSLPKKYVPAPLKRKLFLEVQKKPSFATAAINFLTSARTLAPSVALLVILSISGTVYASRNSLPGQPLFSVRKAIEGAQVKLASSPQTKADLELEFANARLQDAQKVIAESPNDTAAHDLAINELATQTTAALNVVKQSAGSGKQDPALLKKLEDLTKQQESLVADSDAASQKNLVDAIRKIVAVSNDETSAPVVAKQFSTTGAVNFISLKNNSFKIDNNSFDLSDSTVIQDKDGNTLKLSEIGIGDTIKVEGTIQDSKNIATTVTLQNRAPKTTPATDKPTDKTDKTQQNQNNSQSSSTSSDSSQTQNQNPEKPNDTFGNVIIEQPPTVSSF